MALNKRANHELFFMNHMYEQVKDKYDLSDEQMDKLLGILGQFHNDDIRKALIGMRKKKNQRSIEQLIKEQLAEDATNRWNLEPVSKHDTFVFPMGLPLSKDMIIEPHTLYENS